jgi:hypothetical protein
MKPFWARPFGQGRRFSQRARVTKHGLVGRAAAKLIMVDPA